MLCSTVEDKDETVSELEQSANETINELQKEEEKLQKKLKSLTSQLENERVAKEDLKHQLSLCKSELVASRQEVAELTAMTDIVKDEFNERIRLLELQHDDKVQSLTIEKDAELHAVLLEREKVLEGAKEEKVQWEKERASCQQYLATVDKTLADVDSKVNEVVLLVNTENLRKTEKALAECNHLWKVNITNVFLRSDSVVMPKDIDIGNAIVSVLFYSNILLNSRLGGVEIEGCTGVRDPSVLQHYRTNIFKCTKD